LLAGFKVATDGQAIWRIPTANYGTARLTQRANEFAIDPNLGVVVERSFKDSNRTGGIKIANALRDRQIDSIPVEAEPAVAASLRQRRRFN
jgi:hypothetical protein